MTVENQKRIAIAEACGWLIGKTYNNVSDPTGDEQRWESIPDYLNDLNAMHEAEKLLTDEQFYLYGVYLDKITLPKDKMEMCYVDGPEAGMYRELICATATQRAEAFLKTLNLWKL